MPCGPDGQTQGCVSNGCYLVRDGDDRLAILFLPTSAGNRAEIRLQVVGPTQEKIERTLREIWQLAHERSVFRGQVLSFGAEVFGPGGHATPLNFLRRPEVSRDQVVLPEALLTEVERQVIGVARHSRRLLASGQHLKRGVLLHGVPGTGKTHTIGYLLGRLPNVTVIVISGRALGQIGEACSVARVLAPAAVVVEDVDLYQGSLVFDGVDLDTIIERTEGVTAPFLKELLRRAALLAAEADAEQERDGPRGLEDGAAAAIQVTGAQLTNALDELLAARGQLTLALLGGQAGVASARDR